MLLSELEDKHVELNRQHLISLKELGFKYFCREDVHIEDEKLWMYFRVYFFRDENEIVDFKKFKPLVEIHHITDNLEEIYEMASGVDFCRFYFK